MYYLGLDTYEEGEMYIKGEETSGYTEKDFENYRKKYIGNIFQNFNLVNSYTVYQNIELVLLINGYKKHKIKKQILKVIDEVGLTKYKNTKVSKLSGGQKQRVAIARALIKETPIIVADEPTGNLDSQTANSIVELLHKVAKDKLVIVVTHNYNQIEKYATRKIVMHDGKIIEDKKIEVKEPIEDIKEDIKYVGLSSIPKAQNKRKNIGILNKFRLGIRNAFNIKIKFLLLFAVFLFITTSVFAGYTSLKKKEYDQSNTGYNNYFLDTSDKRIIIKKKDNSEITKKDYQKIEKLSNVDYIVKNDLLLDARVNIEIDNMSTSAQVKDIGTFDKNLVYGKMPTKDNEVILYGSKDSFYLTNPEQRILNAKCNIRDYSSNSLTESVKIVGIAFNEDNLYVEPTIYVGEKIANEIRKNININSSKIQTEYNEKIYVSDPYQAQYKVVPNKNVPKGYAYVSRDMNYLADYGYCVGDTLKISVENMYFKDNLKVEIDRTYTEYNFEYLTGEKDYKTNNGAIYVNQTEYENLFKKGNYQSSIFIKDVEKLNNTLEELEKSGFTTLYVKDCLQSYMGGYEQIIGTINVVILIVVGIILFFISYFIIKIILKSRNVYFSTIRILGATRKNAKSLLKIELFTILNIAFAFVIALIVLINKNIIINEYIQNLISFLKLGDVVIAYIILVIISLLIANTYSKKLFKKSAMNTYRDEEV